MLPVSIVLWGIAVAAASDLLLSRRRALLRSASMGTDEATAPRSPRSHFIQQRAPEHRSAARLLGTRSRRLAARDRRP